MRAKEAKKDMAIYILSINDESCGQLMFFSLPSFAPLESFQIELIYKDRIVPNSGMNV